MKGTNNKQRKIISVFYEEYRKKILTDFDFEAVVNGAMVETIDGRQVKIDKIDKEKRRIYGFIYNKDISKWGHELWWDENGYILGWENIETYTGRESLAILNYGSLVKNKVKKGDCKKIIKPFNIDAALNGALVRTKDGHEVEIDLIINHPSYKEYCIFGNIFFNGRKTSGEYYGWHANGRWDEDKNSNVDLVIVEYVEDNSKTDNSEIKNIEIKYNGTKINIQIEENNGHVQGKIIKPFNLDAVRRGAQIETKDGKRVIVKRIADKPNLDDEIICCDVQDSTGGYLSCYEDCLKEGIYEHSDVGGSRSLTDYAQHGYTFGSIFYTEYKLYETPREAFADLVDGVLGKGVWKSNPHCICYEFELID